MKFKLIAVRLSYPALSKPRGFDESTPEEDKKYEATFLFNDVDHAGILKQMKAGALQMLKDKYGATNVPKGFKFCFRSGMEKEDVDGYGEGITFIGANSKKRIPLVDQRVRAVEGAKIDEVFYAGCYVNATVRLWIQDNKFGKRVNCEVLTMQKHSDGEPFGEGPVNPEDEFEAIDGADSSGEDEDLGEYAGIL